MILAVASCLSLAVSASAANTVARKATYFRDFDKSAWYAEAVSAAVDNGLLYGKSSSIIDPNGAMTRAEMAAIINRSFGCYWRLVRSFSASITPSGPVLPAWILTCEESKEVIPQRRPCMGGVCHTCCLVSRADGELL